MKRLLILISCFMAGIFSAKAQGFPTISTDDETKWYLIQFMNGGNALTAETSGAQITTATATGSDAQLWKITGDATDGYTLTNKKGYTLYVSSAAKNQMVKASSSKTGVYRFFINAYACIILSLVCLEGFEKICRDLFLSICRTEIFIVFRIGNESQLQKRRRHVGSP